MAEHAVLVTYRLSGEDFGSVQEWEEVRQLERRLAAAIDEAGVGEFDGNEFGGGRVVLFAYGPNAAALFAAIERLLRDFPARPASVVLRFGEAADPTAREVRVDL
jgi:hypothetical protein